MSVPAGPPSTIRRVLKPAVNIAVLAFAVHVLLPQVATLQQGFQALRQGRWPFLLVALFASALTYVAGGWLVRSSVPRHPPLGRTVWVQFAASFAAIVTPMGLGWVVVNEGYLRRQEIDEGTARAATGLTMVLTLVSHVALLVVLLPFLAGLTLPKVTPPQRRVFVDASVVVAVAAGAALWVPWTRKRVLSVLRPILQAVPGVLSNPRRTAWMVLAAVSANVAYGIALQASVAAFGPSSPLVGTVLVYLFAATVAAIAPTPGGLGAMETALVAGLTRLAVPGGQAVAATLAFRLVTFWLPVLVGGLTLRRARAAEWI